MTSKTRTSKAAPARNSRAISRPHDPAEVQADKAADVVARGGSVSGWSFGATPLTAGVHREEKAGTASNEDKMKDAAKKAAETALDTKEAKALIERIKALPEVKAVLDFLETTTGKVAAGGAIVGGVAGLAAGGQPLPIQPKIPLDKIGLTGVSAQVKIDGPLDNPTFVGLTLTYKEQIPKPPGKTAGGPTETERMAADQARFREGMKSAQQRKQEAAEAQAVLAHVLAQGHQRLGITPMLPLRPGDKPKVVDTPPAPAAEPEQKKPDEAPVQREPASATESHTDLDGSGVDDAVRGDGTPLDDATRRSMESRFGYDFSSVRMHSDAQAATAAAGIEARAFTVGEDIVLGHGEGDTTTPHGRHLLAHELAHVIQQRDGHGPRQLQRRSIFESVGILLGLVEGSWSDTELRAYLQAITKTGRIDGSYDADNKARAIVRKWKAGDPGWDLVGPQKGLLIDEMLDGPTLGDDEECILDLLERSDAGDLREIFAKAQKRTLALEDNIQGDNRKRLNAFEASRFRGGRTELLVDRVVVVGNPIPAGAPTFAFDPATLEARLDTDHSGDDLIAIMDTFSASDRTKAVDHLLHRVWPKDRDTVGRLRAAKTSAANKAAKKRVERRLRKAKVHKAKVERILSRYFIDEVGQSVEALRAATAPQESGRYEELRDVLRPKRYTKAKKPADDAKSADEDVITDAPADESSAALVKFHDPQKYAAEVEPVLLNLIDKDYEDLVTSAIGARAKQSEIEPMADLAKDETDRVFDAFYDKSKKHALRFDQPAANGKPARPGRLHSYYDKMQREYSAMTPGDRREAAREKIRYYYTSDPDLLQLNDTYGAEPDFDSKGKPRNDAAKVLDKIAVKVTTVPDAKTALGDDDTKNINVVTKILRTERNWGGVSQGSEVFVDLVHSSDVQEDQRTQWDMFQTLIHEYLHTLTNTAYDNYAEDEFGYNTAQWNTLVEGMCSVLTDVVWESVAPRAKDAKLRAVVEGPANSRQPPVEIKPQSPYPSHIEAMSLVEKVGIRNVYAAYFLGLIDRISAPLPKKPKKKPPGSKP